MSKNTLSKSKKGNFAPNGTSILYKDSGCLPFASILSMRTRQMIYHRFMATIGPCIDDTVLDIGVTSDRNFKESNFFEQLYPHKHQITCVGTEDGAFLEAKFPGVRFVPVIRGQSLPFPDKQFDIAFSNAVIEHIGNHKRQRFFIREVLRVARRFFIVIPNRWFPVEVHTGLPLLHYLPPELFRFLLSHTNFRFWSSEDNLNLLSRSEFARLFPHEMKLRLEFYGIGLGTFMSHIIAYGHSIQQEN